MASSSSNVVGVHYRVGKKIGEGSFGVIFEGTNLLNNQQVAIKFVRVGNPSFSIDADRFRNRGRATLLNYVMNTEHIKYLSDAVSSSFLVSKRYAKSLQPVYLMSITLAKRACTTSSSLISSDHHWKTCSTIATEGFPPRQL